MSKRLEFRRSGHWAISGSVLMLVAASLTASGCGYSGDAAAYHTATEKPTADSTAQVVPDVGGDADRDTTKPVADAASSSTTATGDVPDSQTPAASPAEAIATPSDPSTESTAPQYEVLVKQKDFKKDPATGGLRVVYDDLDLLKVLNMKQATAEAPALMPAWLKDLDGKRVRIRGYMHPQSVFQEVGISRFVFCRDTGVCCFGPNPTIYYLIEVTMKKGTTTRYIDNRPFDVVGTFQIQLSQVKETGEIFQLYHINDAEVIER